MYNFEKINNSEIKRLKTIIEEEEKKDNPDQDKIVKYKDYLESAKLFDKIIEMDK